MSFPDPRESIERYRMKNKAYVYILASGINRTLYIGVTSDIGKRNWEHKGNANKGFSSRYNVNRLVYIEEHENITTAIAREKAMKKWRRAWKIELIVNANPEWHDISSKIIG